MREGDLARRNVLKALTAVPAAVVISNTQKFTRSIAGKNSRHEQVQSSSERLPSRPWPVRGVNWNIDALTQYDIRNYGAAGDNKADDTPAVQNALNAAAAGGGGVVYIPTGTYKVGRLIFPPNGGHWVVIWMDGSLHLTQTLEMNQRAYALIGRGSAVFTSFQHEPSVELHFDTSVNPVIRITADPIYIEGITLRYLFGDGIVATDGATDLVLKRVYAVMASNIDPQWVPLRVENSHSSFGLYVEDSVFQSSQQRDAYGIVLKNYSIVSIKDTTLMCGGIALSASNIEAANFEFDHVLYEGAFNPFLKIDNSGAWFTGITLNHVELADPAVLPIALIDNSGNGTTAGVLMTMARNGSGTSMVSGNSPIKGLYVFPASTTDRGHVGFLGQEDFYAYFDSGFGLTNLARLSLGFGGTPITKHLSAVPTLDFPTIPAGGQQELSFALTGAKLGDSCDASPESGVEAGLTWASYVSGQDTVVVRLVNSTPAPIAPSARAWRVDLWQH